MREEGMMVEELKVLKIWEEVNGILQHITVNENEGVMVLNFTHERITVPFSLSLKYELERRAGQKICLLRTDMNDKPYLFLEEENGV